VIAADVEATNGVIHVVDSVLLPNAFLNIPGLVQKNYNLTTLLGLVAERPDILEALSDPNGSFTVFAPTNEAFEDALAAFPDLTEEQITEILTYHVIAGATVLSTDLEDGASVETLQGEDITVNLNDGVQINNANVVAADIAGTNGVVHVIDAVILPPSYTE
jgi:transforming growth factor-beta-induced protein